MQEPALCELRLVGGTALALQSYFEDAEDQFMPRMFVDDTWEDIKQFIVNKVKTIKL